MLIKDIIFFLHKIGVMFTFNGNENTVINGFSVPNKITNNTILWIKNLEKINLSDLKNYQDLLIVTSEDIEKSYLLNVVKVEHSKAIFFTILEEFFKKDDMVGIGKNTFILTSNIGKCLTVGNNCFIGKKVIIGENVKIGNNVSIENTVVINDNTVIHSGSVIGTDGFGFFKDENGNNKRVPHYGGVVLGKDVEIGANVTINRGTLDDTVIGNYTKIGANQLIPHNVVIGENCLVLGQMGGSCHIGANSYIAPYSFIKNQVTVGKNCMVNMGTIVREDIEDGYIVSEKRKIKMDYKLILNL